MELREDDEARGRLREMRVPWGALWVGIHAKHGLLIFDPLRQDGLAPAHAKFYVVREDRETTFRRADAAPLVVAPTAAEWPGVQVEARPYVEAMARRMRHRETHCFACGSPVNTEAFSICPKCGWIKCGCGACGCSWSGRGIWRG